MDIINFVEEKDRIHWKRCQEKVKNLQCVLELTGEELFCFRMLLEIFLQDIKPTKNKTCKDILDNLVSILYKVEKEVEVYEK